jgi:hypothetical protein
MNQENSRCGHYEEPENFQQAVMEKLDYLTDSVDKLLQLCDRSLDDGK